MSETTLLDDIPVMAATVRGAPATAGPLAFERLESALPSLRGRKFYGFYDATSDEYTACVGLRREDDPPAYGLDVRTIPGGRYARCRLRGEPDEIYPRIGPSFEELAASAPLDRTRPWIEFYRRRDEVVLLLPVLDAA